MLNRSARRRIVRIRKKSVKKQLDLLIQSHVDYGKSCAQFGLPPTRKGFLEEETAQLVHPEVLGRYLDHEKVKLMLE